jgi:hypothetical protein
MICFDKRTMHHVAKSHKPRANNPAAGKAGIANQLAIGHSWPGLPEPGRSTRKEHEPI